MHTGVSWSKGNAFLCFAGDESGYGKTIAPPQRTGPEVTGPPPGPAAKRPAPDERRVPLRLGDDISVHLPGPRGCTGMWIPATRRRMACPHASVLPTAKAAGQCPRCESDDPGKRLAKGLDLSDPREFALYLAYFGRGLVKVGLTAVARGTDRLTEQGALAYTWLAAGPLRSVRRAELTCSGTGTATERLRHRTKLRGRWGSGHDAAGELTAAHRTLTAAIADVDGLVPRPPSVVDLRDVYGLTAGSRPDREITDIEYGARLTGVLRCLVGRDAVLDTRDGSLLLDLRLLAGRRVEDGGGAAVDGVEAGVLDLGGGRPAQQETLF